MPEGLSYQRFLDFLQNISYMCLITHFIDEEWKLHKRINNFYVIPCYKGKEIGKMVEFCLIEWGCEKLCIITVDNVSSNKVMLTIWEIRLINDGLLFDENYFHMRCCAHILNLIVRDIINEVSEPILEFVVRWST